MTTLLYVGKATKVALLANAAKLGRQAYGARHAVAGPHSMQWVLDVEKQ